MEYKLALNKEEIAKYIENSKILALDIETSPLPQYRNDEKSVLDAHKSTITGMSFSVSKGRGIYVPFHHKVGGNADFVNTWDWIQSNILMNENLTLVIHNAAFETMFFYALGCIPQCKIYDTLAAAQMTLKADTEFRQLSDCGLKKLVPELLKTELPTFSEVVSQAKNKKTENTLKCELGAGSACFDELCSEDFETICYACADSYSQAFARFIQCEEAISTFGFLGKHPTTGNAIANPFVQMSISFQKQANLLWYEIFDIVKQNCSTEFVDTPLNDDMELLLTARKARGRV